MDFYEEDSDNEEDGLNDGDIFVNKVCNSLQRAVEIATHSLGLRHVKHMESFKLPNEGLLNVLDMQLGGLYLPRNDVNGCHIVDSTWQPSQWKPKKGYRCTTQKVIPLDFGSS